MKHVQTNLIEAFVIHSGPANFGAFKLLAGCQEQIIPQKYEKPHLFLEITTNTPKFS